MFLRLYKKVKSVFYCVIYTLITSILLFGSTRYFLDIPIISFIYSLHLHIGIFCFVFVLFLALVRRTAYGYFLILFAFGFTGHAVFMTQEYSTPKLSNSKLDSKPSYRILSFNILKDNVTNGKRITDEVLKSGADLVSLLEAMPVRPYLDRIVRIYPYRIGCGIGTDECDLVLLSKKPFLQQNITNLSSLRRNRLIVADVMLGDTLVHVITGHFSKPYYDEYHASELRRMASVIGQLKEPIILAGDFNATSIAPDMRNFLRHSGMRKADREPGTWPIGAKAFGVPIDHIYARPPLTLTSIRRIDDNMGSNHYGLIADFSIY